MENRTETLVILSPGFPANEGDTTCMPPQQHFVKALKEICPDLNIIVLAFQYPFARAKYNWFDVNVIAIGGRDKGRIFRVITWVKAWLALRKINKKYQVVGLLSFWVGECAFVGNYFAKLHRLTHYSWILGQDAKKKNKYFKWIKPRGESLVALSDFLSEEVKKNYRVTPFEVVPVGIDTTLFRPDPLKRDIDILGAGSLIPLKQYHLFVECINYLREFFPDIKAVICGKGPEMERLQMMAKSLNLGNSLAFAGELQHQEVLELMQRSKVFLHTSNYEGFGAVLAEALYAGAHVVSFCKPMAEDFNHHHVVRNKEEINLKILSLLKSTRRNHERVLMFRVQCIAKNMISLFAG